IGGDGRSRMILDLRLQRLARVAAFAAFGALGACGQSNTYMAPPPPKVTVAKPVEQKVTRYFEATGNTAAINSANLVARVEGIVTARQVSIGELVGGTGTQVLATIVQLDPIHVDFTASERDVLHVRDMLFKRGQTAVNLLGTPIEVGLQTDAGFPHKG